MNRPLPWVWTRSTASPFSLKKKACAWFLFLGNVAWLAVRAQAAWDFSSLLERAANLDRLYEPPGHRAGMASSYDRSLRNGDAGGFIREENGRFLMADLKGPGAVVRLWSANPSGKIWIHLDDAKAPVIEADFRDLFLGKIAPFTEPFVGVQRRENERCFHWAYVPIPFAKSCRIYLSKVMFFQATHVQFPPSTPVETLTLPLAPRHREAMARASRAFTATGEPPSSVRGERHQWNGNLAPGETKRLADLAGPAVVRALKIKWPDRDPQAGRRALLTMAWDGEHEPSVRVPLTDFFGSGFKTLPLGVSDDGTGYCYFPMPFEKSATICVVNEGKAPLPINAEWTVESGLKLPVPLRTFHASWRRELETRPAATRAQDQIVNPFCDPGANYLVADLRGRGHYVATMLHRHGGSEGDEYVLVDSEPAPGSSPGTGNEDYFNMAWGPQPMDAPLSGGKAEMGVSGCFRAHLVDAIVFERTLRFSFEVFCGNNARYDYDTTGYWYQQEPHAPFGPLLPASARTFRTLPRPPEPGYVYSADPKAPGLWHGQPVFPPEGEDLPVLRFNGPRPEPVDMLADGPDWSGGRQLLQRAEKPGASFAVKLPTADSDGWHELTIRWTTGPEYGLVRLGSNRPHDFRLVDGYARQRGAKYVPVGAIQRTRGDNAELQIEIVGRDKAAASAWVGLDCLTLDPTSQPLPEVEVITAPNEAWRPCPRLAPPTVEQKADAKRRHRELPPAEALEPAAIDNKPQDYRFRTTLRAPAAGVYRLDWRVEWRSVGLVPPRVVINGREVELDPRRFAIPALQGEQPRRFYLPLRSGDNELTWTARLAPRQWFAPVLRGAASPPEGVFEAEDLAVKTVQGPPPRLQPLRVAPDGWSGRGHLWFTPPGTNTFFELIVPVRKAGPKILSAFLTHAYNYGTFQVSVDGRPLGRPYDGYHGLAPDDRTVLRSQEVVFGALDLAAGEHLVRFEVVGKNPQSRGYMVGVDSLTIQPANKRR